MQKLAGHGRLGGAAYWGGPGPDCDVPGLLGIAPPSFWPAFTLSKAAVENGKIWSVPALRIVTLTAFGNCLASCQVSCQMPSRPLEGEGNAKRLAHQHDRIGELKIIGVDDLGRDGRRKWRPIADQHTAARVVRFAKAHDFESD